MSHKGALSECRCHLCTLDLSLPFKSGKGIVLSLERTCQDLAPQLSQKLWNVRVLIARDRAGLSAEVMNADGSLGDQSRPPGGGNKGGQRSEGSREASGGPLPCELWLNIIPT